MKRRKSFKKRTRRAFSKGRKGSKRRSTRRGKFLTVSRGGIRL